MGARVIKIERPDGGDFCRDYDKAMHGVSSQFVWTNRSKESFAIDVKSPLGQRAIAALLPRADVFLQNLAPGAAARLGLDAKTLVAKYPRLIACDISGYGSGGPYAAKKAYDLLMFSPGIFLAKSRWSSRGQMRTFRFAPQTPVSNHSLIDIFRNELAQRELVITISRDPLDERNLIKNTNPISFVI